MCKHLYIMDITGARHTTKSSIEIICAKCGKHHKRLEKKYNEISNNTLIVMNGYEPKNK